MRKWLSFRTVVGGAAAAVAAAAFVFMAPGAAAGSGNGPGALDCPTLTVGNPTHYDLLVGSTVTCTIDGASDVSGQTTVTVFVKSSSLGNTTVTGTVSGSGSSTQITFSFTAPTGGCFTTIVAYGTVGNNADNAVITPGGTAAAGFRYVDSSGNVVTVCGVTSPPASALTVSKTASGAFDRTWTWGITKSVDQTKIVQSGTTATFNYTVSVTHDAGTDSGWTVTGAITVFNPNLGDAVVNVSDVIGDAHATCAVTGGTNATIPALTSQDFSYTCTGFQSPTGTETNTGTATWGAQILTDGSSLAAGSANGTATVDWDTVTPAKHDDCVSVTDTLGGSLGAVCSTDPSPTTFTYSHQVTGTPGTCTTVDNTATFTTNTSGTTGSASQSAELCVGEDLSVAKTATPSFTRTYNWTIAKGVDQAKQDIPAGGTATFNYSVTASETGFTDSAWLVTGTITVSNPNDFESISLTGVVDAIDNGGNCSITSGDPTASIAANDSVTLGYQCTYSSAPSASDFTNTATASWDAAAAGTPDGSAQGTASGSFDTPTTRVNQTVTVSDSFAGVLGTVTASDTTPFTSQTFTYSREISGVGGTCTSYPNTATIVETGQTASQSVTVCVGEDLTVSKTAAPSFTRTFTWGISKSVDKTQVDIAQGGSATFNYTVSVTHDSGTDSGWQVAGTITVTNPNDWEAITANIADAIDNSGTCTVSGGTGVSVPASGSVTVAYVCTFASNPGSGTNTATASWDATAASTPDGSATGTAAYAFGAPTTIVDGSVTVTDTFGGALGTVSYTDPSPTTFTYSHTFTGDPAGTCTTHNNTATFTTDTTGTTGSASQSVKVCVGADLTVSKTTNPGFTRSYSWNITKSVDKTLVKQVGGTATFTYTVVVHETGFTDSGWHVSGSIKVTNPNNWESVALTGVTDSIDHGGSCSITSGSTTATIPASGSVTLGYNCTFTSNPVSGTNTATATWNGTAASTPDSSATGTAAYTFGAPTTRIHQVVTVTDTFAGTTTTLGTVTATDTTPFASRTFTYSRTVNVPAFNCVSYTNTAKIVETGQNASRTVTVCGPLKTGALTMGFWRNVNGQNIINGANQAALGTWLNQFHAFSDAPSSGLGLYVTNIVNAAVCTSATNTCNTMLRAQMLATALDVYFSDPALGGNKIGAASPIGGITIDLTNVGGTENVSSAFGGATSMTVMNVLLYQNTSDPLADNGAVWYGQVKSLQVLAKDAFNGINNQIVFGP